MKLYQYLKTTDIVGIAIHFGCWALLLNFLPMTWCLAILIFDLRIKTLTKDIKKRALKKLSEETYLHAVEAMEHIKGAHGN